MPIITNNMVSVACRIVYGRCWDNSAITTKERQNDMRRALRAALKQPVSEKNMPPSDEVLLSSNKSVAETIGWVLIDKNDVAVDFVGKSYDQGYGDIVVRVAPDTEWANRRDKIFRGLAPHRIAAVYSAPQPPVDDALDAARYRWLRSSQKTGPAIVANPWTAHGALVDDDADDVVDAAMAKDGEK